MGAVGATVEERVRFALRVLRVAHGTPVPEVCRRAGISRGTYFNRMNGSTSFTIGEVAELADLYGVTVDQLCRGGLTLPLG